MGLSEVRIASLSPSRFRDLLGEGYAEVESAVETAGEVFAGRAIWHLNSTARGGGVAELLQSLLAYTRGAGVDTRWAVVQGDPEFFRVTKRLHNNLHGWGGDGGPLSDAERRAYEATLTESANELRELVRPGDIVFCHDPQTAGLVAPMVAAGARVVWRCHIGIDEPNELARGAWDFLRSYIEPAHAFVFSRKAFVWDGLPLDRVWIVPPSIDAFSPKNQDLDREHAGAILSTIGLAPGNGSVPVFTRLDGSPERVDRRAGIDQDVLLAPDVPVITQVSRWDALKDPLGVLRGFAEHLRHPEAHLVLAGPEVAGVADDPEGAQVLADVRELCADLEPELRARIHLVCLPMDDVDENAAMVNAIQRRADVIVQKSLAEGFGLTITEAMWKSRPVVASRRGAIQDMITDGETGVLLDDPTDLVAYAAACDALLSDPDRAARIGAAGRQRVFEQFLGSRHLIQYVGLLAGLLADG